eukprot:762727-Hanusia_phi.AAC.6
MYPHAPYVAESSNNRISRDSAGLRLPQCRPGPPGGRPRPARLSNRRKARRAPPDRIGSSSQPGAVGNDSCPISLWR